MDRLTSMSVFVKVVDCGGFSAAARRLSMSVTMVSNHVQSLEERLGARLLNRTTRSVGLTETGKAYYERCVGILSEIEDADRAAGASHSTPMGTLRIHTNQHIGRFLAPVIGDYLRAYPAAGVDVTGGDRVVDLVEEGYDLAVRTFLPPESTLIVRSLSVWRHILCASSDYFDTHPPIRTLEDLRLHNCVRYPFYAFTDGWHFTGPDGKKAVARISGNLVSNTAEILRIVALQGLGVFLAPSFLVEEDMQAGRLVEILPDWRPVEFNINALYPHRHQLSSKVRIFVDLMAAHFARHRRFLDLTGPFQ